MVPIQSGTIPASIANLTALTLLHPLPLPSSFFFTFMFSFFLFLSF